MIEGISKYTKYMFWKVHVCCIFIQISLKFILKSQVDHVLALARVVAWSRIGDMPLPKSLRTKFYVAVWRQQAAMGCAD